MRILAILVAISLTYAVPAQATQGGNGNNWWLYEPVPGPQGDPGPKGPKGDTGPKGEKGNDGRDGRDADERALASVAGLASIHFQDLHEGQWGGAIALAGVDDNVSVAFGVNYGIAEQSDFYMSVSQSLDGGPVAWNVGINFSF